MELFKIETGSFKLDGGAMFGVVPKVLWNKVYQADENNLCTLSLRCLLVKTETRLILIDTGIGNKQSEKFFGYYYPEKQLLLADAIQQTGFTPAEITDVILTHLHFDHCGGAVGKDSDGELFLQFPNAWHWVSEPQWLWSQKPNYREKASYLSENIMPIFESGKLKFIQEGNFGENIQIRLFNGHSEGVVMPILKIEDKTLAYVSDVIPTIAHFPVSWVCGFDTRPLVSMKERVDFLKEAESKDYTFFFEHDYYPECCSLISTEKGVAVKDVFDLNTFLNG